MKKHISLAGAAMLAVIVGAMLCVAAASATPNRAAATTVRIWTDKDRHAAICQSRRHLSDTANISLAPATRLKAAIL